MLRPIRLAAIVILLATLGCDLLINLNPLDPARTTVRLVNNGDFDVTVVMFIDDEQDIPEDVLTEVGSELQFTLAPGESTSFSRDCDDLQAIIIDDADLEVVGSVGPETSSDVLRDGSNFGCGDTITFTFEHSDLLVDFDVTVSVSGQ